jgi:hypothetical protein
MCIETGLENVPEIIEWDGYCSGSWPNISGAKYTGTVDNPFVDDDGDSSKKYRYIFNNLLDKKATFHLELYGLEFEYLKFFKIIKIASPNCGR